MEEKDRRAFGPPRKHRCVVHKQEQHEQERNPEDNCPSSIRMNHISQIVRDDVPFPLPPNPKPLRTRKNFVAFMGVSVLICMTEVVQWFVADWLPAPPLGASHF